MIQDQSPDFEETWQFLDRRIQDVSTCRQYSFEIISITDIRFVSVFQMQRLHDCSKQMRESTVALEGLFRTVSTIYSN